MIPPAPEPDPANELSTAADAPRMSGGTSMEQIVVALAEDAPEVPRAALAAADAARTEFLPLVLTVLMEGNRDPFGDFPGGRNLYAHALYLVAKWREKLALPLILHWIRLEQEEIVGLDTDMIFMEDGPRILASVCGGEIDEILRVIENPALDEFGRSVALEALAVLVKWDELSTDFLEGYLFKLADTVFEKEQSYLWFTLAGIVADLGLFKLEETVVNAIQQQWVDPTVISLKQFREAIRQPWEEKNPADIQRYAPILDVAAETADWECYQQPIVRAPKIGRNEQCPCGSGKKYKKCCGKGV